MLAVANFADEIASAMSRDGVQGTSGLSRAPLGNKESRVHCRMGGMGPGS